jgi:hypothetical protein
MCADVAELLKRIYETEAPDSPQPNFTRLVKDSQNNVRDALMKLETELMAN